MRSLSIVYRRRHRRTAPPLRYLRYASPQRARYRRRDVVRDVGPPGTGAPGNAWNDEMTPNSRVAGTDCPHANASLSRSTICTTWLRRIAGMRTNRSAMYSAYSCASASPRAFLGGSAPLDVVTTRPPATTTPPDAPDVPRTDAYPRSSSVRTLDAPTAWSVLCGLPPPPSTAGAGAAAVAKSVGASAAADWEADGSAEGMTEVCWSATRRAARPRMDGRGATPARIGVHCVGEGRPAKVAPAQSPRRPAGVLRRRGRSGVRRRVG